MTHSQILLKYFKKSQKKTTHMTFDILCNFNSHNLVKCRHFSTKILNKNITVRYMQIRRALRFRQSRLQFVFKFICYYRFQKGPDEEGAANIKETTKACRPAKEHVLLQNRLEQGDERTAHPCELKPRLRTDSRGRRWSVGQQNQETAMSLHLDESFYCTFGGDRNGTFCFIEFLHRKCEMYSNFLKWQFHRFTMKRWNSALFRWESGKLRHLVAAGTHQCNFCSSLCFFVPFDSPSRH